MYFRRFTAYLLISTFSLQTCLPVFAMDTIEEVTKNATLLKQGAVRARLNFKASAEQTAAGCLFYARRGSEVEVLLGHRDDEDTYCNVGGKSDKDDKTLADTAARESAEEALSIYCPHSDLLRSQPFVDLYSIKNESNLPFLNRMYFIEQEHISATIFNDRLKNAGVLKLSKHSQEYRNFTWVLAKDLLAAIKNGNRQFTTSNTGEEITLFEPLYQTLLTHTSVNLLTHLVTSKRIPSFSTQKKLVLKNQLHHEAVFQVPISKKVTWKLPEFNAEVIANEATKRAKAAREATFHSKTEVPLFSHLALDRDAFGNPTPSDALVNRFIMGRAVAAKGAANLEIKQRDPLTIEKQKARLEKLRQLDALTFEKNIKNNSLLSHQFEKELLDRLYTIEEANNAPIVQAQEHNLPTLSDLLLEAQLGSMYVKAENPADSVSRRKADIANLKLYYALFANGEGELKRDADPIETDFERLAEVMELERQYKNWVPLHHASEPEVKFLWAAGSILRELLALNPAEKGTNPGMRATDIYFRGLMSMAESLRQYGTHDYENGNQSRRLCGNMAVTAGLRTTHTSSNSVEYFCNSHSVLKPSILKKFQEAVELLGMLQTSYLPYQSLYEQYFGCVSNDVPNSAWTTVFVNPDELDTYSYPAHGGGSVFYVDAPTSRDHNTKNIPSALGLYERARGELTKKVAERKGQEKTQEEGVKPSLGLEKVAPSIAEMRLLLHPTLMWDPSKVKTISLDRTPLTEAQQRRFRSQLTACTISDVGRWLSDHSKLMPDSLLEAPAIKKLYALAHQGLTGDPVVETVSIDAFPHLVRHGHADGVQQFYDSYPEVVNKLSLDTRELTILAMNSGSADTLKFILAKVLKKPANEIFSHNDIIGIISSCIERGNLLDTHAFVLENVDLTTINVQTKRAWTLDVLAKGSESEIRAVERLLMPISDEMIDEAILKTLDVRNHHNWSGLIKYMNDRKGHLAEMFLKYLTPEHLTACNEVEGALKMLVQEGLSYSEPLPTSGNPLLFYFPYFRMLDCNSDKHLLETVRKDSKVFDYTNRAGLTLLAFIQRNFLKGQSVSGIIFRTQVLEPLLKAREQHPDFYPPYLEECGPSNAYLFQESPFGDQGFLEWHPTLKHAMATNLVSNILEAWRRIPNSEHLSLYTHRNPSSYCSLRGFERSNTHPVEWDQNCSELTKSFKKKLEEVLSTGQYSQLFPVIHDACEANVGLGITSFLRKRIPDIEALKKERRKHQGEPINSWEVAPILDQPEDCMLAVQEGRISQDAFCDSAYAYKDKHKDLLVRVLPLIFPDPMALITRKNMYGFGVFEQCLAAIPQQAEVVRAMLDYGGCFNLMPHLSEDYFNRFLYYSSKELVDYVELQCPEIFTFQGKKRDFLVISLGYKRFQTLDFYKAHLKQLKETCDKDGIPLVFSLGLELPVLMQLIEFDPSILKLTTRDGLGVEDLLVHFVDQDSEEYEQGKKLLAHYKSLEQNNK